MYRFQLLIFAEGKCFSGFYAKKDDYIKELKRFVRARGGVSRTEAHITKWFEKNYARYSIIEVINPMAFTTIEMKLGNKTYKVGPVPNQDVDDTMEMIMRQSKEENISFEIKPFSNG